MLDIYTICAIVGGTLFSAQLLLMLCGFGGDHGGADHDVSHDAIHDQGSAFGLHGMFTLRALIVGLTFFGLAGRIAANSDLSMIGILLIAAGAGLLGLFLVAILLQSLNKLEEDDTAHIEQALGEEAIVYLTIPGQKSGMGKITVKVQNRSMEYGAITEYDTIHTGETVEVVDLVDGATLKVAPVSKSAAPATPISMTEADLGASAKKTGNLQLNGEKRE